MEGSSLGMVESWEADNAVGSEDRLMRGGRSLADRVNPLVLR